MTVDLLILNYNGRELLARCLPSILAAAQASRYSIAVWVIDNGSSDGSRDYLRQVFPEVRVWHRPNRGLCSYNDVLTRLPSRIAILMNNDIVVARDCFDRLLAPLMPPDETRTVEISTPEVPASPEKWHPSNRIARYFQPQVTEETLTRPSPPTDPNLFFTAARLMTIDGRCYEGQKTAVTWRHGLVSATSLFPGAQRVAHLADATASGGALIAVDRELFLQIGGFDPVYLPGRLEDLDLAFRAYLCGWHGRYVPQAVGYHIGGATFNSQFGEAGCLRLAWRNTFIFQWKNLRHPLHRWQTWAWLPIRIAADSLLAPWRPRGLRFGMLRAFCGAVVQCWRWRHWQVPRRFDLGRERLFFDRFSPARLADPATTRRMIARWRHDAAHPQQQPPRRGSWFPWFRSQSTESSDGKGQS
jgi:GT2 family glycosyltransferase